MVDLQRNMRYYANIMILEKIMSGQSEREKIIQQEILDDLIARLIKRGRTPDDARVKALALMTTPFGFEFAQIKEENTC